ncbi:MAG: HNH endonuclease [Chloroflexi bacterium]|nr:HNH endonuclease [Chloroflexota bacterium]
MEYFKRNPDDQSSALRFLRDLERLAYGLFIRRADINRRIRRYADLLRAIKGGSELFTDGPLQLSSDEKSEILEKLDGPIYSQLRVRRQLMLRLDSLLADEGVTFQHKVVSIEHVLPQNPKSGSKWLEWFPDEEIRNHWTHRLANLVLLSRRKNSQANNRDFNYKKTAYFMRGGVSPFALTTQVINEDKWTPDVLERRQEYLINKLKKEWRLD